jgi:hypothetical protein
MMISIPLVLLIVLFSAVYLSSKVDAWLKGGDTSMEETGATTAATGAAEAKDRQGGADVADAGDVNGGRVVALGDEKSKTGAGSSFGDDALSGSTFRSSGKVFVTSGKAIVSSGKAVATYVRTMVKDGAAVSMMKLLAKKDGDEMLVPMVKILMTVFQIVSTMPYATEVIFPPTTRHLFEAMTFVNFASLNFGSPECYVRVDYVDKLMIQSLAPLSVVKLLFFGYIVYRCRTNPHDRGLFVTCFFLITCESKPRLISCRCRPPRTLTLPFFPCAIYCRSGPSRSDDVDIRHV